MEEIIKKIMEEAKKFNSIHATIDFNREEYGEKKPIPCETYNDQQKFWIESMIKVLKGLKVNITPSELHWDTTRIDQAIQLLKTYIN